MLYIDDIAQVKMSDGSILLYADDICLYQPILSCSDVTTFQKDVDILASKISNLGLDLSIGKCKFMLLSRKKSSTHVTLSISGLQLEQVSSYTYLGFLVTSNLSWSPHIQHLCTRARRQLGIIRAGSSHCGALCKPLGAGPFSTKNFLCVNCMYSTIYLCILVHVYLHAGIYFLVNLLSKLHFC